MDKSKIEELRDEWIDMDLQNPGYAIAIALGDVADALRSVAFQIQYLGNGNAATPMGAMEAYCAVVKEVGESIAAAIGGLDRG